MSKKDLKLSTFAEFRLPPEVYYGQGALSTLKDVVPCLGSKVLIISDEVMEQIGHVERCVTYVQKAGAAHVTYMGVNTEPTDVYVDEALQMLQEQNCDLIVAVGGGSCIDTAKAVAVVATNGGYIGEYVGGQKPITKEPVPLIAIPTTAGTGSEVTSVTVITNTTADVKMMIKHPAFIPAVAIVDPLLTVTSPPKVTAATGVDALCHAIEAYLSRMAQPLTDTLSLEAIRLISSSIRRAYQQGEDLEARDRMALGSMQAGIAFSNASVCLVHGMSRPIGALFHVPHGVSNAMLLPAVLEYTLEACIDRMAVIGRVIKPELEGQDDQKAAQAAVQEIKQLCRDLNIPNMKTWGIDESRFRKVLDKMAQDALASGSPANNPRVPTHEEIVKLYEYCYDYDY
ncbi:iron-containing alcohol dehydrogenase [Caldalkalibacillus thermarum TA2.A1]|uniref:Iron-containing alcohol dehydrogenase n=1 Tax=Caldalkalibacillus thermarum (strain TA2.A1) TaxID=986075 RepID=A0A8X8IAM7_CALTT|nr:iron-containing alcohol dehydrogenase [Caldalkalibacillus thermarum TA2.A1]